MVGGRGRAERGVSVWQWCHCVSETSGVVALVLCKRVGILGTRFSRFSFGEDSFVKSNKDDIWGVSGGDWGVWAIRIRFFFKSWRVTVIWSRVNGVV